MSAGTGDKFSDTYNAANPNVARVTSTRAAAATSLSCDNLAGWPTSTSTKVHFSTYKINTSGAVVAGTQIDWTGIVTGNTIGSMVRVTGATDNGNAVNDVVEMNPTAKWASELVNGILVEHTQAGVHALTANSTLTSSKFITALNDTNGNELFKVTSTASAVNEFTVANAATGAGPTLSATGGDTNVDINLSPKGTGTFLVGGNLIQHGAWTSYTPTWTASVSNPSVGNGTITGKWRQVGKSVTAQIELVIGSTSSLGSGFYRFSLPVTPTNKRWVGTGWTIRTGTAFDITPASNIDPGGTPVTTYIQLVNAGGGVTNATRSWGTGDVFAMQIEYEAA